MKKNNVYLCGPIEGLTPEQQTKWRNDATFYLRLNDITTLDPCRRTNFVLDSSAFAAKRIFKSDLQDISYSTVILANLCDSLPGRKWGSIAEIAHAHTQNKIIIVVMDEGQFMHPFISCYATEVHFSLNSAINAVKEYYL